MIKFLKILALIVIFNLLFLKAYSKIEIKVVAPLTFTQVNSRELGDKVVGVGEIEIFSDNPEEDFGKQIEFKFPDKGFMTNRKNWIKIEKFELDRDIEKYIVNKTKDRVKFYGIIDRRAIGKNGDTPPEILEGDYIGVIPIITVLYSRPMNRTTVETELETPAVLPEFDSNPVAPLPGLDILPIPGPPEVILGVDP